MQLFLCIGNIMHAPNNAVVLDVLIKVIMLDSQLTLSVG